MPNVSEHTLEHLALDVENYFDAVARNHGHNAVWYLSPIGERMIDLTQDPDDSSHMPYVYNDVTAQIGAEIFGEYNGVHYTVNDDLTALAKLPVRVSLGLLPPLEEFRLPIDEAAEQLAAIIPAVRDGAALIKSAYSVDTHIKSMATAVERVSVTESRRSLTRIPFFGKLVPTENVPTYEAKVAQLLDS